MQVLTEALSILQSHNVISTNMFADLHAHILHDIDDGPKDLQQAVELVEYAANSGIDRIIATPHFYAIRHGLEERISLAESRYNELVDELNKRGINVSILLGYEVRFFEGISRSDSLDKLCINGSKVILLELGYINITDSVINEILELECCGYTVVLAHIERYAKLKGFNGIKKLIKKQIAVGQINADSFISGSFVRIANKLLKDGYVSVLGSDMHSVELRPPLIEEAFFNIEKRFGADKKRVILNNANRLFAYVEK